MASDGVPVRREAPETLSDDIARVYWALVRVQTVEMWLRGDIRWCSMAAVLR